eukprot:COSAG01_NODE_70064_length_259_cov_1.575000_1_plen_62_part_01
MAFCSSKTILYPEEHAAELTVKGLFSELLDTFTGNAYTLDHEFFFSAKKKHREHGNSFLSTR